MSLINRCIPTQPKWEPGQSEYRHYFGVDLGGDFTWI
jgi:hypothetical protein